MSVDAASRISGIVAFAMWTLVWHLLFCRCTGSSQVILYDTAQQIDLHFATYPDSAGSWTETTYNVDGNTLLPSMTVCAIGNSGNVSNWFRLPFLPSAGIDTLYVNVSFGMRDCSAFQSQVRQCKQVFGLLSSEAANGSQVAPAWEQSPTGYTLVQNVAADNTYSSGPVAINNKKIALSKANASAGIYIAFFDGGTCVQIVRIVVYYKQCDAQAQNFALFDATTATSDPLLVYGRCTANAQPTPLSGGSLSAFCLVTGNWLLVHGPPACVCSAGYQPASNGSEICTACAIQTYKAASGQVACSSCQAHSHSMAPGATACNCDTGYYRADGEDASLACSGPPSSVQSLSATSAGSDQVRLAWLMPANSGGRSDVVYSVTCNSCPPSSWYSPSSQLTSTTVNVYGLAAGTLYVFSVLATNGVSSKAPAGLPAVVSVTTATVSPSGQPSIAQVTINASNSTAISLSWTSVDSADSYSIAYYPMSSPYLTQTVNSTLNQVVISGLQEGTAYYFQVSSYRHGKWLSASQDELFTPSAVNGSPAGGNTPTTIVVIAIVAVLVGMGVVIGIIVVVMVTVTRRSGSQGVTKCLKCVALHKLLVGGALWAKPGCCGKKQTSGSSVCSDQPWHTNTSAAAFSVPPLPPTPSMPLPSPLTEPGTSSLAPLFTLPTNGLKTYVDPHTYEDPRRAVREFTRELDASYITIESVIGGGEFGDVCRGILRMPSSPDMVVAIKTLKGGASDKSRLDFLTEASIMGQFDDPNIIFLEGVVTKTNPIMIVTEFMENGSLDTFLRANDNGLSMAQLVGMLRGIASGMQYLANMNYVHRDLAARNILVNEELVCKVADFGLSREVEYNASEGAYTTRGGKIPVRWTAPEAIAYRKFTSASDVWSYGVVMWEVVSFGERPYWNWSNQDVIKAVDQNYRLPPPMDCPAVIYQLMLSCWQRDRSFRPKFAAIVQILEKLSWSPDLLQPMSSASSLEAFDVPSRNDSRQLVQQQQQMVQQQQMAISRSVEAWLSAMNMECYLQVFIDHGCSTTDRIAGLTCANLESMGIKVVSHQMRIMKSVQSLRGGEAPPRTLESSGGAVPPTVGFLV